MSYRIRNIVVLLLLVGGAILSALTVEEHMRERVFPGDAPAYCNISATINCAKVVASPYSVFLGLPLGVWGFIFYALLLVLEVAALRLDGEARRLAHENTLLAALGGFIGSIGLFAVSKLLIGAVCPLCFGTYVVNFLLLVVAWGRGRERKLTDRLRTAVHGWWLWLRYLAGIRLSRGSHVLQVRLISLFGLLVVLLGLTLPAIFGSLLLKKKSENPPGREAEIAAAISQWRSAPEEQITVDRAESMPDHPRGAADPSAVQIIEYADFECGYCRMVYPILHSFLDRYPSAIQLVLKHYPLDKGCNPQLPGEMHRFACKAAAAAICAGEQGGFWPATDALMELEALDGEGDDAAAVEQAVLGAARELVGDRPRFDQCISENRAFEKIRRDIAMADALQIEGTPTIWINRKRVATPHPDVIEGIVKELIDQQGGR